MSDRYRDRYAGQIETSDDRRLQAKADVAQAMSKLFGDRPSIAADSWTVGNMAYIHENGMLMLDYPPRESPAWRRRIEKARREIAEHTAQIRLRELADSITMQEIQNDLQEIRAWANSLRKLHQ